MRDRKDKISIDKMFNLVSTHPSFNEDEKEQRLTAQVDDAEFYTYSFRYYAFAILGTQCFNCDVSAEYAVLERDQGSPKYHFNLYSVDKGGCAHMMSVQRPPGHARGDRNCVNMCQILCDVCVTEYRRINVQMEQQEKKN
jgi:hypothetical protein